MEYFVLVGALLVATLLFVRSLRSRRRRLITRRTDAEAAVVWAVVYSALLGLLLGPIGVAAGIAFGVLVYLAWTKGWHVAGWRA